MGAWKAWQEVLIERLIDTVWSLKSMAATKLDELIESKWKESKSSFGCGFSYATSLQSSMKEFESLKWIFSLSSHIDNDTGKATKPAQRRYFRRSLWSASTVRSISFIETSASSIHEFRLQLLLPLEPTSWSLLIASPQSVSRLHWPNLSMNLLSSSKLMS